MEQSTTAKGGRGRSKESQAAGCRRLTTLRPSPPVVYRPFFRREIRRL
jgi:hypothetical protein